MSKAIWQTDWNYATLTDAFNAVPRTVIAQSGGTGYHPPPDPDALYFPLFEPAVAQGGTDRDRWQAYLRQRAANSAFRAAPRLLDLQVDGSLAQGIFYRGSRLKVPVVRPLFRI